MDYNSDFKFDLCVGQLEEKELGNLLSNKTIEVKTDLRAIKTGNVFIEYYSRNKPSGISTSHADYYCIVFNESFHFIKTSVLKSRCRKYIGTNRDVLGGDNQTSKGILLPIKELL
jgi:hypothetical protein